MCGEINFGYAGTVNHLGTVRVRLFWERQRCEGLALGQLVPEKVSADFGQ